MNKDFKSYTYKNVNTIKVNSAKLACSTEPKAFVKSKLQKDSYFVDNNSLDYNICEIIFKNIKEEDRTKRILLEAKESINNISEINNLASQNLLLKNNQESLDKSLIVFKNELRNLTSYEIELRESTRQYLEFLSISNALRSTVNYDSDAIDIESRRAEARESFKNILIMY